MRLYQKPSGIWAVDYVDPQTRERRRVSTGLRDKALARARAKDIAAGRLKPSSLSGVDLNQSWAGIRRDLRRQNAIGVTTMDALWTRCENTIWHPREIKSLKTLASNLKVLRAVEIETAAGRRRFADMPVVEVRFSHLDALKDALFARGYATGTVKRKMDMVGKSLTQAAKWEVIPARPPMPTVAAGGVRERVISEAEERVIFRVVEERRIAEPHRDWRRYGYLLRFLMDTACRLGEALAATADWFEEAEVIGERLAVPGDRLSTVTGRRWVLNIPAAVTKNGKGRVIPLTSAVVEALPYLRENAGKGGRLFPMSAGTAQYYWRENVAPDARRYDVDLSDVVLHSFRHTKLTRLAKLPGFGIQRVSKWAGHSDIKITAKVYAKLDVDDLWAGV